MYNDNLQIYHSRPRECICEVNSDLSKVFEWSFANSLKLNPSKSMVLPIYRNHLIVPLPAIFLGNDFIPYDFKAKNLVVTLSYNLNWGDHVSTICRKVYGALVGLRKLADVPFLPFVAAFNACVRYVYRRRLFDQISDVSDSILGCFLLTYMEFWLPCFIFSLVVELVIYMIL
jgi:hypothetical protein